MLCRCFGRHFHQPMILLYKFNKVFVYKVGQKSMPVNFCNNFVYCQPIFIIFGTYTRLDIGRKLAGSSEFRLGFLRRVVTAENLYLLGKILHVKETGQSGDDLGENRITLFNKRGWNKIQRGRFSR